MNLGRGLIFYRFLDAESEFSIHFALQMGETVKNGLNVAQNPF